MKEATNIKVRDNLTYAQFGCHEDYFVKHIKGKPLKVVDRVKDKFLVVEDAEGEAWSVFKGDYVVHGQLELYTPDNNQEAENERVGDFQLEYHKQEELKRKAG